MLRFTQCDGFIVFFPQNLPLTNCLIVNNGVGAVSKVRDEKGTCS